MKWLEVKAYLTRDLNNYKEVGVEKYTWQTSGDERVCKTCSLREGRQFDVDESAKNIESLNVCSNGEGCRCCTIPEM